MKELIRISSKAGAHAYDTSVEISDEGGEFWISQVKGADETLGDNPETDDLVYLDERAARAVFLTLKNHFEA